MRWPHIHPARFRRKAWFHPHDSDPDLGWMLDADAPADNETYTRRVHEALAASPVTAGWVLNVQPHRVEGYMGVALWVPMLSLGGRVIGRRIWIEVSAVQDLLDVADQIRSAEFREAMGDFGDSYA
ncbi:hypothetical protein [Actinomadura harenae]|uniref:Uncharacterized protein n=1 Tax=Actinomadura harenae TaxID=2483351 RepID=A0A3M2LPQ9_9ACTN|nr:hypothetical protein [Actinomadura harenae]RMI38065.1 hypothetical protein EBO15_34115 [Actinomadura harenae]